jgi:general secretion pathway protein C
MPDIEVVMGRKKTKKRATSRIPDNIEKPIVVSLANPGWGARRLVPVLEEEGIQLTTSAVYTILKRRGLQNRSRRLAAIDARRPVEIPQTIEAPVQEAEYTVALPAALKDLPPPEAPRKPSRRSRWVFAFLNLLLIALILFLGVQAVQNITDLALRPETTAVPPPIPPPKQVLAAKELPEVNRRLDDYSMIWQRNFFNILNENPPAPAKAIPFEKISLASKKLGLKLVGTVVVDNANQSQAIIESRKNREQKAFREGDQIGKVRIKKIQRNIVVITTERGDELLTLDPERFAKNDSASSLPPGTVDSQSSPLEQDLDRQSQIRPVELGLTREFVTRFLGDPDEFLQNMEISPYIEDDRPAGFQITGITPNNALGKMGLLDGDIIMAINQEAITSPQQAADFLRKLMEGGKIEIRVNRNRSRRLVRLNIK